MTRYKVEVFVKGSDYPARTWEGDAENAKDARERAEFMLAIEEVKNFEKLVISKINK